MLKSLVLVAVLSSIALSVSLADDAAPQPRPSAKVKKVGEYYIGGAIKAPGVYSLTGRDVTLLQAIIATRGVDANDDVQVTIVRRLSDGLTQSIIFSSLDALETAPEHDPVLQPGDRVQIGTKFAIVPATQPTQAAPPVPAK